MLINLKLEIGLGDIFYRFFYFFNFVVLYFRKDGCIFRRGFYYDFFFQSISFFFELKGSNINDFNFFYFILYIVGVNIFRFFIFVQYFFLFQFLVRYIVRVNFL